jgi:hypothetical protein
MPHQCTNCGRSFADGSKEMLSGCPECGGNKFQFSPDGFGDESAPEDPPEPPERPTDGVSGTVGNAAATVRDLVSGSAGPDATSAQPPTPTETGGADAAAETGGTDVTAETATASTATPESTDRSPEPAGSTAESTDTAADDDDIIVADETSLDGEDAAQADARSGLVEPDDLPDSEGYDPASPSETTDEEAVESDDADAAADTPDEPDAPTADTPDEDDAAAPERTVTDEPDAEEADRPDLSQLRKELNDQFESIRIVDRGHYELNLMELYDRDEVIIALQEDGKYSIRVPEVIGDADV